jgi:hypothetical protein
LLITEILRGVFEIIGLGFLMAVGDIYHRVELSREIKKMPKKLIDTP